VIRKLFDQTRPIYIRLRQGRFLLGDRQLEVITAVIADLLPVRKLFDGTTLTCWSVNGSRGKDQRICGFCPDATRCQRRLRLHLLIDGDSHPEQPAVLEVLPELFADLEQALDKAGPDAWRTTLFQIGIQVDPHGRHRLTFLPLF
jgi:hypothetical protein